MIRNKISLGDTVNSKIYIKIFEINFLIFFVGGFFANLFRQTNDIITNHPDESFYDLLDVAVMLGTAVLYFGIALVISYASYGLFLLFRKKTFLTILAIFLGIIFFIGLSSFGKLIGKKLAHEPYDLNKIVKTLNEKTPYKIDKETMVLAAYVEENTITWVYKIINFEKKDILDSAFDEMAIKIGTSYCIGTELKFYRDNDINVAYTYIDKNNKFIETIFMSTKRCDYPLF